VVDGEVIRAAPEARATGFARAKWRGVRKPNGSVGDGGGKRARSEEKRVFPP
jgi:hypothetical protein